MDSISRILRLLFRYTPVPLKKQPQRCPHLPTLAPSHTTSVRSQLDYPTYSAVCFHHPLGIFHSQHLPFSLLTLSFLCTPYSQHSARYRITCSRYGHNFSYAHSHSPKSPQISNPTILRTRFNHSTANTTTHLNTSLSTQFIYGHRWQTLLHHGHFLVMPPISSPPLIQQNPPSKLQYTSYNVQNAYTPQSFLDSLPFYSNSSSSPTSEGRV